GKRQARRGLTPCHTPGPDTPIPQRASTASHGESAQHPTESQHSIPQRVSTLSTYPPLLSEAITVEVQP
ncbi:MAG: hypothetical protein MSA32_02390, partial [Bacteroidales bacterium]|nr:hypothetical protein [Bacteroidales bacterium]